MKKNKYLRSVLDEREYKEVVHSQLYARWLHHGTSGHNQLMLIAKLAKIIMELTDGHENETVIVYDPDKPPSETIAPSTHGGVVLFDARQVSFTSGNSSELHKP